MSVLDLGGVQARGSTRVRQGYWRMAKVSDMIEVISYQSTVSVANSGGEGQEWGPNPRFGDRKPSLENAEAAGRWRRKGDGVQETAGDIAGLICQAKSYDRVAFADLYRCTVRPVHRYLSARVNSLEEAEDLTQEVFVAALAGIQGLRAEDEAGLLKWLFQIARNKMADHLRVRYRRPTTALDDAGDFEDTGPLPDEVAIANDERAELREALEQLTPEQREVVVFKYVLGYANDKTAKLVGKNVNAVNQLHHRALASLHRILVRTERRGSALRKLEKAT